jgi:hypothetical protein
LYKDGFELTPGEDQHPVETLARDGADEALRKGVVRRSPRPGGVDDESPRLGVLEKDVVEPGSGVLCFDDNRLHVVGDDHGNTPPKSPEAALKPRITSSVVCEDVGHTRPCVACVRGLSTQLS